MQTPATVTTLSLPPNTSPSPPVTLRLISEPPLTCSGPPRFMFITWAFRGVGAPACPQAPISLGRLVRRRAADGPLRCRPPLAMPGEPGSCRAGSQLTACSTSAAILASSAAVNSVSAKATGHRAPSSRCAVSLKPNVAYLVLNFCAGWKKQTILPSLAYVGILYQVLGARAGALALTRAWTRSARARSGSAISAIFASTALSPSALAPRGPRRAAVFSSWACSFIAPRSSSVNPPDVLFFAVLPVAGFCLSVIERFLPASLGCRLCRIHLSDPVRRSGAGPVRPLELARRPEPNRNRAALVKAAPGPSPPPADGSEHYETRATDRGLLAAGDQSEPVAVGVFEQRPPAERLLDGRLRELHAAGAQLPVGLLEVLGVEGHVGGRQARTGRGRPRALAKIEHHDHGPVRRAHLQPPLPPVRCVLHELEPQRLGPEHLGPVLVLDLYDDLGHPADHDRHLPPILLTADRLCTIRATMACLSRHRRTAGTSHRVGSRPECPRRDGLAPA